MRPTVLCVDDDRSLCQILARALRSEGYQVQTAHDGEEALAAVHLHQPDLLLLDVMLPKRDGFAVLESMRELGGALAETPVLLLSGCTRTPAYVQRAEALRAAALLTKPLPLETLLGLVAKHLGGGPVVPPRGREDRRGEKPVAGTLRTLPFPALLHHLHGMRASGVLHVQQGRKRKRIEFREGRPVAVRSNLLNECFGNLLVRTGRITQAQLAESVRRMKSGQGPQGEILVAMQLIAEDELGDMLRTQAEEKLFDVFEWREGRFQLERGARLRRGNALSLDLQPADFILAGARGRVPLAQIEEFLRDNSGRCAVPGESPFYRFQEIALEPAERELLARSRTPLPLDELLGAGESVQRAAYGLMVTEMLELRDVEGAAEAPRPSPPAEPELEASQPPAAGAVAQAPPSPSSRVDRTRRAELAGLLQRFREAETYYGVLGVPEDADDEAVRNAYADLAKRTHPDRFGHASAAVKTLAERAFAHVARAYEHLADARRRSEYQLDRRRREREAAELDEGQRALRAELFFQEGEEKLRARDPRGALACFERAVAVYPEEGEYHAHQGWALWLSSDQAPDALSEALSHVRRGAKLAPDRQKTYLFLGRLQKAAGREKLARRAFARAVQLGPDCVEALRELRLLEMRRPREPGLFERLLRRSGLAEARAWPRRSSPG